MNARLGLVIVDASASIWVVAWTGLLRTWEQPKARCLDPSMCLPILACGYDEPEQNVASCSGFKMRG